MNLLLSKWWSVQTSGFCRATPTRDMSQRHVSRVVFVYTRATFAASSYVHVGIDTWVIEYVKYTTDHFVYGEHNINNSLGQPITTLVEHSKAGVTKKNSSAITPFVVCLATIALYFNWLTNKSTMYYQNNIIHWSMSWMLLFPRNKMSDERTCLLTSHALSEISVLYSDLWNTPPYSTREINFSYFFW